MRPKWSRSGNTSSWLRQVRAAGVDQVDAGQAVLARDLLRAQVLLHRHRIVRAALDRRVVADDHAFASGDAADAGDDARARRWCRRTCRTRRAAKLEERRARIEQRAHALARQQLAARGVPFARGVAAALLDLGHLRSLRSATSAATSRRGSSRTRDCACRGGFRAGMIRFRLRIRSELTSRAPAARLGDRRRHAARQLVDAPSAVLARMRASQSRMLDKRPSRRRSPPARTDSRTATGRRWSSRSPTT